MKNRRNYRDNEPVIIIGSGIAGLLLAIDLADRGIKSIVVTKGSVDLSNTAMAQGGLAAVTGANASDSTDHHLLDTIISGDGLSDYRVSRSIINQGGALVRKLVSLGVNFDFSSLALEGGHSLSRVVHSADATGRAIIQGLTRRAAAHKLIAILENCFLQEIILTDEVAAAAGKGRGNYSAFATGQACGVRVLKFDGSGVASFQTIYGGAVVLATGGLGQIYGRTTNPISATGDGIATAYRAGACLADMEFVQFHPTALHLKGAPAFLISEAVRGSGAVLLDKRGERFVGKYSSRGELSTRDIVSRAIFWNMQEEESEHVWLDLSPIGSEAIATKFPNIVAKLSQYGIDALREPIPVSPAAHYFMGGILADSCGRTTVANLFAIGECACTGLHGANRLASNSLLEGGAMAMNLAQHLSRRGNDRSPLNVCGSLRSGREAPLDLQASAGHRSDTNQLRSSKDSFQADLLKQVGLVRSNDELLKFINKYSAMTAFSSPESTGVAGELESENMILLGKLIAYSALMRRESRGAHWRQDFAEKNDEQYRARLIHQKHAQGWLAVPACSEQEAAISAASVEGAAALPPAIPA